MLRVAGICRRVSSSVVSPALKTLGRIAIALIAMAAVCLPASAQFAAHFTGAFNPNVAAGPGSPQALVRDSKGNFFVVDSSQGVVEYFAATNYTTSSTLALTGIISPTAVTLDAQDNLYVAAQTPTNDLGIFEYTAGSGYASGTPLGSPNPQLSGVTDLAVTPTGDVFILIPGFALFEISPGTGYNSTATVGSFVSVQAMAYSRSAGALFVYDQGNLNISKLTSQDSYASSTVLGVPANGFSSVQNMATDGQANLYAYDSGIYYQLSSAASYATAAPLSSSPFGATGLTADSSGNLYFFNGNQLATFQRNVDFGTVPAGTTAQLYLQLLVDQAGSNYQGNVSITQLGANYTTGALVDFTRQSSSDCASSNSFSTGDFCLFQLNFTPQLPGRRLGAVNLLANGTGKTLATGYVTGLGVQSQVVSQNASRQVLATGFSNAAGTAVDGQGNVYVSDSVAGKVFKIASGGSPVLYATIPGAQYLAMDGAGNLFVSAGGGIIDQVAKDGTVTVAVNTGNAAIAPYPLVVDGAGRVNYCSANQLFRTDGAVQTLSTAQSCQTLAIDADNSFLVFGSGYNTITQYRSDNLPPATYSNGGNISALASDAAGNVFIGTLDTHQLIEQPANGGTPIILDSNVTPTAIALAANGDLYMTDATPNAGGVYLYKRSGTGITFAPTPINTSSGSALILENDGNALLNFPSNAASISPSSIFSIAGGNCPITASQSLAPGGSCVVVVNFQPTATGPNIGSLRYQNDHVNVRYGTHGTTVSLTGVGTNPGIATTTTLVVSPLTTTTGNNVSLTATITTGANGTVIFFDGGVPLTPALSPVNGLASYTYVLPSVGTHSITATFTGASGYANSAAAAQTLTINLIPQNITFPQPPTQVGGSTYTLNATSDSGLPVTYTVTSGPATISGAVITYTGHGQVVIAADQAGDGTHAAASTVSDTVVVTAPTQSYAAPSTNVGALSPIQTGYVTFTAAGTLGSLTASSQNAADFQLVPGGTCTVGATYTVGQDCSFNYTFTPAAAGTRIGAVTLADASSNTLATSYVSGTGLGAVFSFQTPTESTFVGTGLNHPTAMTIDGVGNLYVASSSAILKVTPAGVSSTLYTASSTPQALAVDALGNVYAALPGTGILKLSSSGALLATLTTVTNPWALSMGPDGNLYIADHGVGQIAILSPGGSFSTLPATGTTFLPCGIAVDGSDRVFIADCANGRILKVPAGGGAATALSLSAGTLAYINGMTIDAAGDLYVTTITAQLDRITPAGTVTPLTYTAATTTRPYGIAINNQGLVYVADFSANAITALNLGSIARQQFPKTVITTSSPQQDTVVLNTGSANLTFSPLTNITDWNYGGSDTNCSTVAPGTTCTLGIVFAPTVTGTLIETLGLTDNSPNSPQTISVTGEGLNNPSLQLSSSNVQFGSTTVNTSAPTYEVNLSNMSNVWTKFKLPYVAITGPDAAQFTQTNDCGTDLAPYSTCHIIITFTPLVPGNFNATLTVTDYTVSYIQTASITGTGTAVASLLTPSALNFTGTDVGASSASQNLTFANTTNGVVNISSVAITGADAANYILTNLCPATLQANTNCTIQVVFKPAAAGTFTNAAVQVTDNAAGSPQTATLSGTGNSPNVTLSPNALNFGSVAQGISAPTQTVNFSNLSSVPVTITGITLTGTDAAQYSFNRSSCGTTLAPFSSCSIVVTFSPTSAGTFSNAAIQVADSATGSPQTITLTGIGQAPTVSVSATSLTFSNQEAGTNSSTQAITISNTGGGPITFASPVSLTGAAFSQTNNCQATLAQGANCVITVTFTPPATGPYTGGITINDNAGGPHTVALSGTGTNPIVTLSHAGIDFGSQPINTTSNSQTVTFNNTSGVQVNIASIVLAGANPSAFILGGNCGTALAKFSTCTLTLGFSPTAVGAVSASVILTDDGTGSPQTIALTGTGAAPTVSVSASSLTFPSTVPNTTSAAQVVTISNTSGGPVAFTGPVNVTGAGFAANSSCNASLVAGANCTVSITFTPTAAGPYTGTLTIPDNATGGPHTVALSGTSALPVITLSHTNLDFGSQTVTTTSNAQTITVNNQSAVTVPISSIAITGSGFVLTNGCGAQIGANSTCTLTVAFAPTAATAYTATLAVVDGGAGSPHTVALTGTGAAVTASLSPNGINFANMTVGALNTTQAVTLQNTSQGTLSISSIGFAAPGAFTQNNNCGATLAANASCLINVGYAPTVAGSFSSTLVVNSSAAAPLTASITGNASLPAVSLSASNIDFGTQGVNTSSTAYNLNFSNMSSVAVSISNAAITGTNASVFVLNNSCGASVQPNSTCAMTVTFTPTAITGYTGTLTVTSTGGTQTVPLTGTGVTAPDYSMSVSNANLTLLEGQVGVVQFTMTPTGGFKGSVQLSLSNLGSGISASFAPATLTADGSNSPKVSTLTIHTDGPNSGTVSQLRGGSSGTTLAGIMFFPGILCAGILAWRRKTLSLVSQRLLSVLVLASLLTAAVGCSTPLTITPGAQTVTVTATSTAAASGTSTATVSHTVAFTLTVKAQ